MHRISGMPTHLDHQLPYRDESPVVRKNERMRGWFIPGVLLAMFLVLMFLLVYGSRF